MARDIDVNSLNKDLKKNLYVDEEQSNKQYTRKPLPVVPPKKNAQPQVPRSAVVSSLREPSYSSRIAISPNVNYVPSYNNNSAPISNRPIKDYANVTNNHTSYINRPLPMQPKPYPTYSNVSYQSVDDSAPPPLPPPPTNMSISKYGDDNSNMTEYLPPPSPVSSNYSELVRATSNINYGQDKNIYTPLYQNEYPNYDTSQSSTYESLYEPINPRPTSHVPAYANINQNYNKNIPQNQKTLKTQEEEVDALTDLLVKSISNSQDLDVFGTCIKCNETIVAETSGCTAMGNMYHIKCFSCYCCNLNLQGKPFFALEGKPYCEKDYYETLEKCSVCDKPILDRILRATGKPYHPACFTCVVCSKSLDGIPFTVDAMNQIHCIEDFHKKFAPRCCVCELPIMPEEGEEETVRVVALDRSFHVRCYCCEDCGLRLSSEAEGRGCYPLDDHILCKSCNANRVRLLSNVMTTDL